jgi:hypothetical protein
MLLEHYERPLQFIPLVMIVAAVAAIVLQAMRHDAASLRALEIIMMLFRGGGLRWHCCALPWFGGVSARSQSIHNRMGAGGEVMRAKAPRTPPG